MPRRDEAAGADRHGGRGERRRDQKTTGRAAEKARFHGVPRWLFCWLALGQQPMASEGSGARGVERTAQSVITPASPSSVPQASKVPAAFQASAVIGALPGFLARISAPSSTRT